MAAALVLSACGGGDDSPTVTASPGPGTATPGEPATPRVSLRLSGVAAHGAALTAATVRVVDSTGLVVGNTTTNGADGSYTLALRPAVGPLLVQAVGTDATGLPLVLHSAVVTPAEGTAALNINPLTDAAVALALGREPRLVFALATDPSSAAAAPGLAQMAALANLGAAASFVKSIVRVNLTDAKITDTTKLDLFADATFSANKAGVDLALETLAIGYSSSSAGQPQLLLANKLGSASTEVVVDLQRAATELARSTGATPSAAITSSIKTTTSPTPIIGTLAKLDELVTTLNGVLAQAVAADDTTLVATGLDSAGLVATYEQNDGSDSAALVAQLVDYAERRMQIGRLQVLGCLDETIDKTGCKRLAVAARVNDASGAVVGNLMDAASYDAKATPKARWNLVGNGRNAQAQVRGVAWRALDGTGAGLSTSLAMPMLGVQVSIGSAVDSATVQTPGGYVLPMAPCDRSTLCAGVAADATVTAAAGGALAEDTLFSGVTAWLGMADLAASARYRLSLTQGSTTTTATVPLRGVFANAPDAARFVQLDGLSSDAPLTGAALMSTLSINWSAWAAAQPDMRVVSLRVVHTDADGHSVLADHRPAHWSSTGITLEPVALPEGFDPAHSTLWLTAIDGQGRWYHSSIAAL